MAGEKMLEPGKRRIGIYGGTFNPPHSGHVHLARTLAQALGLERVLIIPANLPPHKQAHELASGADRMEMCRLAFPDEPFEISGLELSRGGKSYTCDTLAALQKQYGNAEFYLFMGTDMLLSFHQWRNPGEILRMCRLAVAARGGMEEYASLESYIRGGPLGDLSSRVILCTVRPVPVSSTELRKKLREGREVKGLIPGEVCHYILEKGLYRMLDTQRNEEFIAAVRGKLRPERFAHSLNVAQEARRLAQKYGADPEKAYTAGILHDIMKNSPPEEQLAVLKQAGAVLTADERANPKLWHAMAGEAYARTALQVKDADILRAIRYHTTARAGMSVLEKVLYIADFISADRDYNGVEEMRAAAGVSLEAAMLKGMRFCITDLVQSGQVIHTDSVEAYNEIIIAGTA